MLLHLGVPCSLKRFPKKVDYVFVTANLKESSIWCAMEEILNKEGVSLSRGNIKCVNRQQQMQRDAVL